MAATVAATTAGNTRLTIELRELNCSSRNYKIYYYKSETKKNGHRRQSATYKTLSAGGNDGVNASPPKSTRNYPAICAKCQLLCW
jgi:hypothetical protein